MISIETINFEEWKSDRKKFSDRLGACFTETGFAIISHHDIPKNTILAADKTSKEYFALAESTKRKYADSENGYLFGYTPFGTESAKDNLKADLKEFWQTGPARARVSPISSNSIHTPNVQEVDGFDRHTGDLFDALDNFGAKILQSIAMYLGLEDNWFDKRRDSGSSILRLLHYPPLETSQDEGYERAAAHEDINLITLLLGAEEAGLQALHRSGTWLDINPPQDAIVINCGDMLQRLTGGILPSTTHRVVNPTQERSHVARYSKPFFMHLNDDAIIETLDTCLQRGGVAEPPIRAGDFLNARLKAIGLLQD